jgi:sugar phosphate isomerase/epimerase
MRYAICNETFEGWDHARVCAQVAELGYEGLEIAPFTLAPRIGDVSAHRRRELRNAAEANGLRIIGLHWLLAKTEGLQLTAPDPLVRRRTADYLVELAQCTRDLGGDLMVFGSPAQRRIPAGANLAKATDYAADTFEQAARRLEELNVKLCLEPLSPPEADFINTCAEAQAILDRLQHPSFCLHLDVKAMSTDEAPAPELIMRHGRNAGHFHANDANRRGPGFGATDFVPIFQALRDSGYPGWVSVEVFDYTPDPVTIARESIRYMRACEA